MTHDKMVLEIKMETISADSRTKDFRKHLIFKVSDICHELFSSLKSLKLNILRRNVGFLESLSDKKNLLFNFQNGMRLVDFLCFNVSMAGSLTRPLLQGSGRLLPEREGDPQLLELGRQDGLLAEEGLLPGLVHQAAEPIPHQIPEVLQVRELQAREPQAHRDAVLQGAEVRALRAGQLELEPEPGHRVDQHRRALPGHPGERADPRDHQHV